MNTISVYSKKMNSLGRKLMLGIDDTTDLALIERYNQKVPEESRLNYFYNRIIDNFAILDRIINTFNPSYIRLGSPLTHSLERVKSIIKNSQKNIGIIACPNKALNYYEENLFENGINGDWIRPEDVDEYEKFGYLNYIDFSSENKEAAEVLIDVYRRKEWEHSLSILAPDLNYYAENPLIPPELAKKRMNCNQVCVSGGACHLCNRFLALASTDILKDIKESK